MLFQEFFVGIAGGIGQLRPETPSQLPQLASETRTSAVKSHKRSSVDTSSSPKLPSRFLSTFVRSSKFGSMGAAPNPFSADVGLLRLGGWTSHAGK